MSTVLRVLVFLLLLGTPAGLRAQPRPAARPASEEQARARETVEQTRALLQAALESIRRMDRAASGAASATADDTGARPAESVEASPAPPSPSAEGPVEVKASIEPEAGSSEKEEAAPPAEEATASEASFGTEEKTLLEDGLKLGGMFYFRILSSGDGGQSPRDYSLRAPGLLDLYLDARPHERLRTVAIGRLMYDPTLPQDEGTLEMPGGQGGADPGSIFGAGVSGPLAKLDQLWLRFDIGQVVFVTAGKQHVRWGTGRFWAPADFLHVSARNPLDPFDARLGTTMVKLHVPWEATGWNFYACGLLEDRNSTPRLADAAGAARAELVFLTAELGLGLVAKRSRKPKYGIDLSLGVWRFDLYGELALKAGSEIDQVSFSGASASTVTGVGDFLARVEEIYPREPAPSGYHPQLVSGFNVATRYGDSDVLNIGGEYFYNSLGYSSPQVYPGLILPRPTPLRDPATIFYLGRHYAAVFINAPSPGSLDDTTLTLATLANLSDRTFVSRVDCTVNFFGDLRFEAFAAVHYGRLGGEFRFSIFDRPAAMVDVGLGFRINL
jgi:hypothetical protein